MRTSARDPRRRGVFDELAARIREMVRDEHVNSASGVERFKVDSTAPLVIEQLDGDLVLRAGDPDFSVGRALAALTLHKDDLVWVARSDNQEFHAFDVVS